MLAASEVLQAYLFHCDDGQLFAVSLDPVGRNLPRNLTAFNWRMRTAFNLGVHEPVPASISAERILQGIRFDGYYVWREGNVCTGNPPLERKY